MRRNTKTMYEWRKAYRDKEELMLERGFPEVSPHEFYRDLFPEGSLQSAEHDGKGNLIATQIRPSGKGRTKQWVVDDSLNMLDKISGQGEREWGVGIDTKKALPYTWEKKVQKPIDKISGQGEREWGVGIDTKKALPYTWEKKVQKPIDKISGQGEREWGVKDYGKIHQKER